jgi:hypothetical protein
MQWKRKNAFCFNHLISGISGTIETLPVHVTIFTICINFGAASGNIPGGIRPLYF